MSRWLNRLQPWGVFLLRVTLGASMLYHGWDKVMPRGGLRHGSLLSGLNYWNQFVVHLGLPYWLGYVSAFTEFLGGMFLILGLLTRLSAFLVAINMAVAIATVNIHHGYAGSEYSLALTVMGVMVLLTGPGRLALDRRLGLS